jgi:hypothetical protein
VFCYLEWWAAQAQPNYTRQPVSLEDEKGFTSYAQFTGSGNSLGYVLKLTRLLDTNSAATLALISVFRSTSSALPELPPTVQDWMGHTDIESTMRYSLIMVWPSGWSCEAHAHSASLSF